MLEVLGELLEIMMGLMVIRHLLTLRLLLPVGEKGLKGLFILEEHLHLHRFMQKQQAYKRLLLYLELQERQQIKAEQEVQQVLE